MTDYTGIVSNADYLKKNSSFRVTINDNVKDILYQINTMVSNTHDAGLSKCIFKLPVNFHIPDKNITNTEVQTNVYYKIVTELEKQKYKIKLKFKENFTLLSIEWTVKTEKDELNAMHNKLMSLREFD